MAPAAVLRCFGLLAMTIETPAHRQRLDAEDASHRLDSAVTAAALDVFGHVRGVIEIDEVGQIVDAAPRDRSALVIAAAYFLEQRRRAPDLRMTAHAQARWW